jgi:hypothetical protein
VRFTSGAYFSGAPRSVSGGPQPVAEGCGAVDGKVAFLRLRSGQALRLRSANYWAAPPRMLACPENETRPLRLGQDSGTRDVKAQQQAQRTSKVRCAFGLLLHSHQGQIEPWDSWWRRATASSALSGSETVSGCSGILAVAWAGEAAFRPGAPARRSWYTASPSAWTAIRYSAEQTRQGRKDLSGLQSHL